MLLLTGEDSQQVLQGVAITQTVQTGHFAPAGEFQAVGFAAPGYFAAGFPEQLQQRIQIGGVLRQRIVDDSAQQLPVRWSPSHLL